MAGSHAFVSRYFPPVVKEEEKAFTCRLRASSHARLELLAQWRSEMENRKVSLSAVVEQIVEAVYEEEAAGDMKEWLAKREKKAAKR